ncbi:MAG: VOC family protein [Terriglobales bacterium]
MAPSKTPIPKGFHTATPTLTVRNAAEAIEFYKKAFGAEEISRHPSPDGKISHAELKIGDSIIFLADESPAMGNKSPQTLGGTSGSIYLYVEDVDKAFQRAVNAGGKATMPVTDMFWGDRFGHVVDPYGQEWGIATHKEDVTEQEMSVRAKDFYAQMAQGQKKSA